MNTTLLVIGVGCIIAAIVGGGLKVAGIEIPQFGSVKRQVILGVFGVILMLISFRTGAKPVTPAASSPLSTPSIHVTGPATATGSNANANTGDGNTFINSGDGTNKPK